ncbi:MAG: hypothetical protein WCL02_01050 [bacterium]
MTVELYHTLTPSVKKQIQKELADFLTQLHNIPIDQCEAIGYAKISESSEMIKSRSEEFQKKFIETCGYLFSEQECKIITEYIDDLYQKNTIYRVMTHNDIFEKNLFIDEKMTHIS